MTVDIINENHYRYQVKNEPHKSPSAGRSGAPPKVSSDKLLGPARQLVIVHNGREYCLRLTQNGRLILTA